MYICYAHLKKSIFKYMDLLKGIERVLNKLRFSNPYIFATCWCKPWTICFNRVHSIKYLRSTTKGYKDIGIRISEFVTKTKLLFEHFLDPNVLFIFNISLIFQL